MQWRGAKAARSMEQRCHLLVRIRYAFFSIPVAFLYQFFPELAGKMYRYDYALK
jgi:hypothetical protein